LERPCLRLEKTCLRLSCSGEGWIETARYLAEERRLFESGGFYWVCPKRLGLGPPIWKLGGFKGGLGYILLPLNGDDVMLSLVFDV